MSLFSVTPAENPIEARFVTLLDRSGGPGSTCPGRRGRLWGPETSLPAAHAGQLPPHVQVGKYLQSRHVNPGTFSPGAV